MSDNSPALSPTRSFESWFVEQHPTIAAPQAQAVVRLAKDGGTLPFIARYRKEQTGNLDEVGIQAVLDGHEEYDAIVKQQSKMLSEIQSQGKLTPELKKKIAETYSLSILEDLYLPYKPKRKSKASLAREAGLEPLADWIWNTGHGTEQPMPGQTLELWAYTFRNTDKAIETAESAIQGAVDILVERLSESAELRAQVRTLVFERGHLRTQKGSKAKENSKYSRYFDYRETLSSLRQPQNTHRYLAIRRGWMEEELVLSVVGAADDPDSVDFHKPMEQAFLGAACSIPDAPGAEALKKAAQTAFRSHVLPSIEREGHRALKEAADAVAIRVFSENVRKLLLSAPFGPKTVLGVDPGIRTGCKLALIDDSGKFAEHHVVKLASDNDKAHAKVLVTELLKNKNVVAVAVGNGTGGREAETFFRGLIKELGLETPTVLVNEAGASVYSASEAAREEFPSLDVTVRGAISIARRLQDPLAELVKIDPKSIGVGQYQHDVAPNSLKKSLDTVVDLCVNGVGVNLNTASYHLLAHVAGIGEALAKSIVTRRAETGLFRSRQALLEVPQFGAKAFEQAAGFLRIPESENPLDNTGVHPERYPVLEETAARLGITPAQLVGEGAKRLAGDKTLEAAVGPFTFRDMVADLERLGRDPRDRFVPFRYREDVEKLEDLKPNMELPGIVTNVTNFGAFVDVGVHQDGLVHLSQLCDKFVTDPHQVVSPGETVSVRVLNVDLEKRQIALTMKKPREERRPRPAREERQGQGGGGERRDQRPRQDGPPRQQHRAPQQQHANGGSVGGGQRPPRPSGPPPRREQAPRPRPEQKFVQNPFSQLAALKTQLPKTPAKPNKEKA